MTNDPMDAPAICCGAFEIEPQQGRLCKNGAMLKVGSRALDLLVVLVENAGSCWATTVSTNATSCTSRGAAICS